MPHTYDAAGLWSYKPLAGCPQSGALTALLVHTFPSTQPSTKTPATPDQEAEDEDQEAEKGMQDQRAWDGQEALMQGSKEGKGVGAGTGAAGAATAPPRLAPRIELALVRDAVEAALADLKDRSGGALCSGKVEHRLSEVLPLICDSILGIVRCAVHPRCTPCTFVLATASYCS